MLARLQRQRAAPSSSTQNSGLSGSVKTSDFDYTLPPERIAQSPSDRRDRSKLLIVDRSSGTFQHRHFADLVDLIPPGDAIVLNTTRVFRARLLGTRDSGAPAEVFLLRPTGEPDQYEAMVHPGGKLHPGRVVHIAPGFDVTIEQVTDRRTRIVRLEANTPLDEAIERHGHVPLPPYIHRADADADIERYQTVYARERGSVAAPTAGLHFTSEMLAALESRGVRRIGQSSMMPEGRQRGRQVAGGGAQRGPHPREARTDVDRVLRQPAHQQDAVHAGRR